MSETTSSDNSLLRPDYILRIEALLLLVVEILLYKSVLHGTWLLFALLFLAPDLSLFAFGLRNKSFASNLYNLAHNEVFPLMLALLSWKSHYFFGLHVGLIWLAHISFDRALGYGLKLPQSFRLTHIQRAASAETAS